MLNCFNPDQDRSNVSLDLGPSCMQRLSADENCGDWVQTVCKGYQQMTKVVTIRQRVTLRVNVKIRQILKEVKRKIRIK